MGNSLKRYIKQRMHRPPENRSTSNTLAIQRTAKANEASAIDHARRETTRPLQSEPETSGKHAVLRTKLPSSGSPIEGYPKVSSEDLFR